MTIQPLAAVPKVATRPPQPQLLQTPVYTYFATDWRTGQERAEVHVRGASWNCPLSGHGKFTGTVVFPAARTAEARAMTAPPRAGLRVYSGDVPVWDGIITSRRRNTTAGTEQYGAVDVEASEWGWYFDRTPVEDDLTFNDVDQFAIFRQLVNYGQADSSYATQWGGPGVVTDDAMSGRPRDRSYYGWEAATVGQRCTELAGVLDGPEWAYIAASDNRGDPVRRLILGDPLGRSDVDRSGLVFEYVSGGVDEGTPPPPIPALADSSMLLAPPGVRVRALHGHGGNVIDIPDDAEDGEPAAVRWTATGAGEDETRTLATRDAVNLLTGGWPPLWGTSDYADVIESVTLQAHADADLRAAAGVVTTIDVVTFGSDPDWTQVQRGDACLVILDASEYAPRPHEYTSRVLDIKVTPQPDGGPEQVTYSLAEQIENPW